MSERKFKKTRFFLNALNNSRPKSSSNTKNSNLLVSIIQWFGGGAIVSLLTLSITSYISMQSERKKDYADYLKAMSTLITEEHLYEPKKSSGKTTKVQQEKYDDNMEMHGYAKGLSRALTLHMLHNLEGKIWGYHTPMLDDNELKGQLLKFLYESDLIGHYSSPQSSNPETPTPLLSTKDVCINENTNPQSLASQRLSLVVKGLYPAIVDIQSAKFENANIPAAMFTLNGVILKNVMMSNANLSRLDLQYSNFQESILDKANLKNTQLNDSCLKNASLSEADLQNAYLIRANLGMAYITNANLSGADLSNADLSNADLRGAKLLKRVKIDDKTGKKELEPTTILNGADLKNTKLCSANLSGITWNQKTDFSNSYYSEKTIFPDNFDESKKQKMKKASNDIECNDKPKS